MSDETAETLAPAPLHHPRGMSKWSPILACPCFEGTEGNYNAVIGTKAHRAFANAMQAIVEGATTDDPRLDMRNLELSREEAGAITAALNLPREILDGAKANGGQVEKLVSLSNGIYGTADFYCADKAAKRVVVVDLKTFYNPGRDYFPQLSGYALAVLDEIGVPEDARQGWEAHLTVCYGDSKCSDEKRATYCELKDCETAVMNAFDAREAGVAAPRQCNWCELCDNAPACTAWKAVAERVNGELKDAQNPEKWALFTPARKAQLLVLAENVTKWAQAVREMAKSDALTGEILEDSEHGIAFRLRETRGRLTPRVADLWAHAKAHGVDAQAFMACLTCASTVATKLLQGAGLKKAEAEAVVKACSDEGKGTVSLVRA